jgi:hypothetical protein
MKMRVLTCAVAIAAVPASGDEPALMIDLLPGHPVHHESEGTAGAVMALSITAAPAGDADLRKLCEELRVAGGLTRDRGADLPLEVVFVVPYKDMAIEGYYLPSDGSPGSEVLVRGDSIGRSTLDGIVARAGVPPSILDESDVEHEISCEMQESAWLIRWEDVRLLNGEQPETVIDRAYRRFQTIHQSVVEHAMATSHAAGPRSDGSDRPTFSLVATTSAPAPGAIQRPSPLKP